jgi:hypothetical protein
MKTGTSLICRKEEELWLILDCEGRRETGTEFWIRNFGSRIEL